MTTIIVCPLSHVRAVADERRPSHMITLLDPDEHVDTPPGLDPDRHLRLAVYDICEPAGGMIAPERAHVVQILDFGRGWDGQAPLLVHCWAGISRSTATAFMLACQLNPHAAEWDIAWRLRLAALHAYPNRKLVQLADQALERDGKMIAAVEAIGDNGFAVMGRPFDLPARF